MNKSLIIFEIVSPAFNIQLLGMYSIMVNTIQSMLKKKYQDWGYIY